MTPQKEDQYCKRRLKDTIKIINYSVFTKNFHILSFSHNIAFFYDITRIRIALCTFCYANNKLKFRISKREMALTKNFDLTYR